MTTSQPVAALGLCQKPQRKKGDMTIYLRKRIMEKNVTGKPAYTYISLEAGGWRRNTEINNQKFVCSPNRYCLNNFVFLKLNSCIAVPRWAPGNRSHLSLCFSSKNAWWGLVENPWETGQGTILYAWIDEISPLSITHVFTSSFGVPFPERIPKQICKAYTYACIK